MTASLTIIRYRKIFIPFALLSMMVFRFPFWFNKRVSFWKLLGTGKNGTFDKRPDWRQWGIFVVCSAECEAGDPHRMLGKFISKWIRFFRCETWTIFLAPIEGHGKWDGKEVFGNLPLQSEHTGAIAILTRATIRFNRLKHFWSHVNGVAEIMRSSKGFVTSLGIGEIPWKKQATFSIWESKDAMKAFAYGMKEHADVIRKTRSEQWYSEEMFVRFRILGTVGTIAGKDVSKN